MAIIIGHGLTFSALQAHTYLFAHLVKFSQLYKGHIIMLLELMKESGGRGYFCDLPGVVPLITHRAQISSQH